MQIFSTTKKQALNVGTIQHPHVIPSLPSGIKKQQHIFTQHISHSSLPSKLWWINGRTLNESGYYHGITLTKHRKLNLDRRHCEEDPAYNFTVCIKEKLSEKVGCRLPWDKRSQQGRAVCKSEQQIWQFEQIYMELANANGEKIVKMTGCKKPCHYKEYKLVESSPKVLPLPSVLASWAASQTTQKRKRCCSTLSPPWLPSLPDTLAFSLDFLPWQSSRRSEGVSKNLCELQSNLICDNKLNYNLLVLNNSLYVYCISTTR